MAKRLLCQSVRYTVHRDGSSPSPKKDVPTVAEAVLIVSDGSVPLQALDRQCEALTRDGLPFRVLPPRPCGHWRELPGMATACDAAIKDWHGLPTPSSITLLVWCPLASPLRLLPLHVKQAQAALVRVYGPPGHRRDGCPDHWQKGARLPDNFFDGDVDNWDGDKRIFTPDNSPATLAWRRLYKTIKQTCRAFAVLYESDFRTTPLTRLDLPLVNGQLLGESDDDPRN